MKKTVPGLLAAALFVGTITGPTYAQSIFQGNESSVFVMTNDNTRNEILTYQRLYDGAYVLKAHTSTEGRGSGGTTDPLQSQGSLTLSGDHNLLFAVNSASGTVASFHVLEGIPVFVDKKPSGGAFPVAVTEHNNTVYVLNAGGSGAIDVFRADGFGRLQEVPDAKVFLVGTNSGASSISVSPDGRWLVVIEKVSNSIDVFPLRADGTLGKVVLNSSVTPGVFATVFTPAGQLIVSENQPSQGGDTSSISSYRIQADGTLTAVSQSIPTQGNGNCWNAITPDGKWVYVDNAGTFTVASFSVTKNGTLTPAGATIAATLPEGANNLDLTVSGNGKYLFNLLSGTGAIGVFKINSDGSLNPLGEIEGLPKTAGLNGIAAL